MRFLKPASVFFILLFSYCYCNACTSKTEKNYGMQLKMPSGDIICAEKAITPQERAKGLMFRKKLSKKTGMIFLFENDSVKSFWMKNTFIPLDIVFLDENFVVLKVFENVPASYENAPENEIPVLSYWARNVLEINAGAAKKYGIYFGKKIEIVKSNIERPNYKTSPSSIKK